MPNNFLWATPGAADTLVAGSDLNALADGAGKIGATAIDNSADRKTHMDIWFKVDTDLTSVGDAACLDFYILYAPDGTNFPDPPGSTPADVTDGYYAGSISSVKRGGTVTNFLSGHVTIEIKPLKFKIVVFNALGVALPSNNNTICQGYRYSMADG